MSGKGDGAVRTPDRQGRVRVDVCGARSFMQ